MAASRVLGGSGGLGLLLSGLPAVIVAFVVLYSLALVISPFFYDAVENVLEKINESIRQTFALIARRPKVTEEHELLISDQDEQPLSPGIQERSIKPAKKQPSSKATAVLTSLATLGACILVTVLQCVRPVSPPYAHMSGSLPITIIEAAWFQPINSEFCLPHPVEVVVFPFDKFTKFFNRSNAVDWFPQSDECSKANGPGPPPWLEHPESGPGSHDGSHPPPPPHGQHPHGPPPSGPPPGHRPHPEPRDDHEQDPFQPLPFRHGHGRGPIGESTCAPLALSNFNASFMENLVDVIKEKKPTIKNVLLLTMESTRKDMFPLKKGSHAYKTVLATYPSGNGAAELDAKLRDFGKTATFLTDETSGFESHPEEIRSTHWKSAFKDGMGGININGAITQAAYTLKSLLSSHCGVEPLAVDFAEETKGNIYQPCLPQIFEKMSSVMQKTELDQRDNTSAEKGHDSWPWDSAMVQSVTDQFDTQDVLMAQMGFKNVISESTISDPKSKHYPPKQPWVNYFGYPEPESLEYIRDLIVDAKQNQKRLFLSHLTSTPHHPFATPKDWEGKQTYMNPQRWRPEDPLDGYLNTIKYQDDWISQIFQMLHDVGVLNETLVVMTGDHGLAFKAIDKSQSAVNNGHYSNFAIPMLFVHPDLPRIQVNASTTPLSIIPTVLDLLLSTSQLAPPAAEVASSILPKYQGDSLIRNLDFSIRSKNESTFAPAFFQPFHFSAINPGGSLIAISDASTSFRLIFPLCSTIALRFTDISTDPTESHPIEAWTIAELSAIIKVRHGHRAKEWAELAAELGRWWVWRQREKWGYWGNARETSRGGAEVGGAVGRIKKEHWWETK